ncbi:uncharacterized protein A4U43_C03F3330 [Asparagus officinalis]|uniref:RING-type E3 ubiquitin transferase n=1 Tax=Asparagus officinalis TaxID=4686 RepID=A0A5P1F6Z5_ASPOF|nr:uncharacterized protein A4U43_C03F3330 [Asparagus officinalis]
MAATAVPLKGLKKSICLFYCEEMRELAERVAMDCDANELCMRRRPPRLRGLQRPATAAPTPAPVASADSTRRSSRLPDPRLFRRPGPQARQGSLECAVCLSEFDDDESLRLLPRCDHVFHPDCIDAWLAAHVTCPVCRCNLEEPPADPQPEIGQIDRTNANAARPEPEPQQVAIQVGPAEEDEERKAEIENLEKFVNTKRARSRARPARFPRSHSTGHSLVMPGENLDRFTLRLPTNIRKEIVERAEMMQRAKSLGVYPAEGSSRRGGGGGGGRSIQLGRSDRWGSFLMRTLSMKMTNWGRRGDGDGSSLIRGSSSIRGGFFRRGDSIKGEGSTKGGGVKFNAFDCYGGAATKSEESQSSAFNRV